MIFQYIYQNDTADKPLSFQSPALKAAINQLLTIAQKHGASGFTPQQILDTNIADEDIKPEMFFLNAGGLIGHFGENPDGASRLFPFTFEKDEQAILDGYLEVAVINPNSKRMAEALSFLEILSRKETNPVQYTLLHQNADQAVANPNAKEWLQALQEEVQLLEKAIEKANQQGNTQDAQQLNRELTVIKEAIEGGAGLWLMTEQEVQAYRPIQPQIKFFENSALLTENAMEQIRQSTKRLMGGQLTTDMFLNELDRIAKMVYAETR
jgi:ABC-type glycerol-3-phosphate transport system substrate-binding protein